MVKDRFSLYGTVTRCQLVVPTQKKIPSDSGYSYAFVRYEDEKSAVTAIQNENGKEWAGSKLRVQYAESKMIKQQKKLGDQKPAYSQSNYYGYNYPYNYYPYSQQQSADYSGTTQYQYYPYYNYYSYQNEASDSSSTGGGTKRSAPEDNDSPDTKRARIVY